MTQPNVERQAGTAFGQDRVHPGRVGDVARGDHQGTCAEAPEREPSLVVGEPPNGTVLDRDAGARHRSVAPLHPDGPGQRHRLGPGDVEGVDLPLGPDRDLAARQRVELGDHVPALSDRLGAEDELPLDPGL